MFRWIHYISKPPTATEWGIIIWGFNLAFIVLGSLSVIVGIVALSRGVSPELAHDVLIAGALALGLGIVSTAVTVRWL
jgi:hypothetical protein